MVCLETCRGAKVRSVFHIDQLLEASYTVENSGYLQTLQQARPADTQPLARPYAGSVCCLTESQPPRPIGLSSPTFGPKSKIKGTYIIQDSFAIRQVAGPNKSPRSAGKQRVATSANLRPAFLLLQGLESVWSGTGSNVGKEIMQLPTFLSCKRTKICGNLSFFEPGVTREVDRLMRSGR